ncbi:MAG: hypothetical protein LBV71_20550 [Prevotella sp.]|jgi:hypothetical protein|nr:hypothetical protein [Prevotella sp.]
MADKKEFTLLVNGVEKSTENVEKLSNSLEKVDVKAKGMSVTAKDVADTYKNELKDVIEYIALQMAKIEAIITELSTHAGQAIEKNIEAGEKLAESMGKSADSGLSSIKIKAIEASTVMEAYIDKITAKSEVQTTRLEQQLAKNKELVAKSLKESTEKTEDEAEKEKKIGILNLKAYKERAEERVAVLKKYKEELEVAGVQTKLYYSSVISQYAEDSEQFKQKQKDKEKALEELQKKILETDKTIKESNKSYLDIWNTQHGEIKTKLENFVKDNEGGFDKFLKDSTYGFHDFAKGITESVTLLEKGITDLETKEKAANDEKYKKKLEKLDKELEEVRAEASKYEKEKEKAEKEQAEAKIKAEKYKNDIKKIEDSFKVKNPNADEKKEDVNKPEESTNTLQSLTAEIPTDTDSESKDSSEKSDVVPVADASEEEIKAAYERIEELDKLAKAEEEIVENKQSTIENANNRITESNRSVLLEQMRIEDDKKKLEEEKAKKDAEIAEKAQKRKEKLEKLEKIKAKAQLVLDIATATKEIAKGVATAWGKGPILGPPLAALVALNGAMQLKIMTAQLAKFEDGGLLRGKRHAQGGMRIEGTNMEVEGGEYVVNRVSTNKNLGLVKYINEQRRELSPSDLNTYFSRSLQSTEPSFKRMFADGGQLPAVEPVANIDNENLIKAIQSIRIEPKVAVTDIAKVQESMVSVDGWVGV